MRHFLLVLNICTILAEGCLSKSITGPTRQCKDKGKASNIVDFFIKSLYIYLKWECLLTKFTLYSISSYNG